MSSWQQPLPYPLFASALTEELVARELEAGEKEQAHATPFRFSQSLDCSRKLALRAAGFEATDPMDGPSLVITNRGTLMHEIVQEAISKRFPNAKFEIKGIVEDLTSGHCDALVEIDGALYIWELKNVGAFAFDKAIGLNRKGYSMKTPEGPRLSAVVQGGLNAIAHGAENVVIAYISNEAVSVQLARKVGLGSVDRIMAEWLIPREVWEPITRREIDRLRWIKHELDLDLICEPWATDDDGKTEKLNPTLSRPNWRCEYCSHRKLCEQLDPQGAVTIKQVESVPVAIRRKPAESAVAV